MGVISKVDRNEFRPLDVAPRADTQKEIVEVFEKGLRSNKIVYKQLLQAVESGKYGQVADMCKDIVENQKLYIGESIVHADIVTPGPDLSNCSISA